ncbi:MFS transporter [Mucilaginibacter phyllosphaerae]|uniref:MFS transporter n=1 Tax=Mucilaginibacter phyllosphaerae TaxID=1812349 RepID=A0A4Y8AE14_9SPHI|nr:MFS transporter [Mucilaginibacter phyllosphaerae]MBB3971254.1 NRE family putative nickel resistance protein-like MFS transporter [Mucilaginibacter phyllosphaerae]TEW66846.1 MFS transporter [Mucilaginibacter phyllosphaerae]GGH12305.1 MFS transporter [Mucilaginibacter phyllosphaerae]
MNKKAASVSFFNALKDSFQVLKNRLFSLLYFAEAISLLGDAFTWVGLALLSYQFGRERSAIILATALTLRVTAFILFSPFAGVLADRVSRKTILYTTHFVRMAIVACLPFVTQEWQIYALVFLLNIFNAFFTPTYRAVIPQVVDHAHYRQAVGLSTATFQILGVLGPGLAGILAVWFGARQIFFIDAASFVLAAVLILLLPATQLQHAVKKNEKAFTAWHDAVKGIKLLFKNPLIRFALFIEFVSAIAGAQILVNSVGHIKSGLHLGDKQYGWVMAAFGIGASIAAFVAGSLDKTKSRRLSLIAGALVLSVTISITNFVAYPVMLILWLFAGLGQSLAEMPSETLIGENIAENEQGKVYGSHFAFSHLWWAIAYPIAGFLGSRYAGKDFLYGGLISMLLLGIALFLMKKQTKIKS